MVVRSVGPVKIIDSRRDHRGRWKIEVRHEHVSHVPQREEFYVDVDATYLTLPTVNPDDYPEQPYIYLLVIAQQVVAFNERDIFTGLRA